MFSKGLLDPSNFRDQQASKISFSTLFIRNVITQNVAEKIATQTVLGAEASEMCPCGAREQSTNPIAFTS